MWCEIFNIDTPVMVCTQNDTPPNISIPVVMIPKSTGDSISVNLSTGRKGEYQTSFLFVITFIYNFATLFGYRNSPHLDKSCEITI